MEIDLRHGNGLVEGGKHEFGAPLHLSSVPAFVDRARVEIRRLAGARVAQAAGVEAGNRPLPAPALAHGLDERFEVACDRVDHAYAGHQSFT